MGRRPGFQLALGRDGGQKGGKLRANFFVKYPDGSEEIEVSGERTDDPQTMRSGSNGSHTLTLPRVWREAEMEGR